MNVTQLAAQVTPYRLDEECISAECHPNLHAYASSVSRSLTRHDSPSAFLAGYARFGDEMEEAVGTFETKSGAARRIARGLEDPWMAVGLREAEFSGEQRALMTRVKPLALGKETVLSRFAMLGTNNLNAVLEWLPEGDILYRHAKYSSWASYAVESAVMRRLRYKGVPSVFYTMLEPLPGTEDSLLSDSRKATTDRAIGLLNMVGGGHLSPEEARYAFHHAIPMEYAALL